MNTVVVWLLIVTSTYEGNHRMLVDNIDNERNCRALGDTILRAAPANYSSDDSYLCVPVRKVAAK